MKKNRWRQGAASVAAAAVLWLAAVCAGSDDLASAAAAVRQSELARCLLQWELADLLPTDSLPLPALLALGQSPQLLAAQEEISRMQAVSPEKTETPAPPDVFIKNASRQTLDGIRFDGTFAAAPGDESPQVLILHTHGSEAYTMPAGEEYVDTGSFRTADASVSVIRVGDELARVLSGYGLSVLHDRALYDDPEYNGAYYRAEDAIEEYMAKYPGIRFILDVHRDALEDKAGHQYKVVTREDPDCAQVSLVMGSSWEGWQENLKFAVAVQQHLTESHPTLMRPLTLRNSDYNEYFTTGSLLVEVGAAGNSLDEALKAAQLFGHGLAEVITAKASQ